VPAEGVSAEGGRRLILVRHAKSDWPDVPDRERPLAKRGRREAPSAGHWLREHGYQPDVVVCSVARRTRQTWELIAPELGGSPVVRFEQRAYDAGAQTLLYLARELPGSCRTALFVGHNPAVTDLANALAETPEGPPHLHFSTAALAVLEFTGDWADLAPGRAQLAAFTAPAGR
jgi:phosphohistidine phosphatase